ncbi:unnamed protein product, partial [Sphacelaria rigidula]
MAGSSGVWWDFEGSGEDEEAEEEETGVEGGEARMVWLTDDYVEDAYGDLEGGRGLISRSVEDMFFGGLSLRGSGGDGGVSGSWDEEGLASERSVAAEEEGTGDSAPAFDGMDVTSLAE